MANKHLIGKLTIQIEVSSSENAYGIQQQWSEMTWKSLVPELDKLFNDITGENEVIRFNCIALDIGDITLKKGEETKIVDEIITRLRKFIKERLNDSYKKTDTKGIYPGDRASNDPFFRNSKSNFKEGHYGKNGSDLIDRGRDKRSPESLNRQSLSTRYFELWLHWLEKGVLPTYAVSPEDNWIERVLENLVMDYYAVTQLRERLKKHPLALQRLVLQHTPDDLISIAELYTGYSQKGLLEFFKEIRSVLRSSKAKSKIKYRPLETEIWTFIFKKVILEQKKLNSISLGHELIKLPAMDVLRNELKKKSKANNSESPFLQELFQKHGQKEEEGKYSEAKTMATSEDDDFRDINVASDILEETIIPKIGSLTGGEMESPQFFKNAGLVLLHPFLIHFFDKAGLIEGKEFADFESRSKAVLLLHFLATGKEHLPEYEMVLPKFLCEMPSNLPLDHTLSLSRQEKEEAHKLLQAVIGHWGVLGTTSPDGLREGFLMREGKLEKEQTGWKLYVEQKAQDVLLDRLPWTLSILKLPWMKEMLSVEWR